MRRVLVVAYYFPPMGLSGVQRVAKFARYLPHHGWQPTVLTVEPAGYFAYDESLLRELEEAGIEIVRTTSWDPTRLFGRGRTVPLPSEGRRRRMAFLTQLVFVPDNKVGWLPHAYRAGRRLLRRGGFDAILSSAPPYTAHLAGALLSRRTGLPLVADFRDDWVGNPRHVYPTPLHRKLNQALEGYVLRTACRSLAINEPIRDSLAGRHGRAGIEGRLQVLPQGYDPADFAGKVPEAPAGRLRFLYSGIFYDAQTPEPFLRALAALVARSPEARRDVEAVFVGLVPEGAPELVERLGIGELVRYEGYVDHERAVAHLRAAGVLWMTVGRRPGAEGISTSKLFEYFGTRKPILALVPEGAAREALRPYGASWIAEPDDVNAIGRALEDIYARWKAGRLPAPDDAYVRTFDRRELAGRLAHLLGACAGAV